MASLETDTVEEQLSQSQEKADRKQRPKRNTDRGGKRGGEGVRGSGKGGGSAKLRGLPKDSQQVRVSKTLSWILRHGSQSEGLAMRQDGYVRVEELLGLPKMRDLNFEALQQIVKDDAKGRYSLALEEDVWWIRANQGHSMKSVALELEPITSLAAIPTGIAVHGTTKRAWESIKEQGLSKMTRNHIHLAQGVPGSGVISGMRNSSQILIFIDIQKALNAGVKFYLSTNGVVLTEGDEQGYLRPQFFSRVETPDRTPLPGWDGLEGGPQTSLPAKVSEGADTQTAQQDQAPLVGTDSEANAKAVQSPLSNTEESLVQNLESVSL